jgi:hypothetical protein
MAIGTPSGEPDAITVCVLCRIERPLIRTYDPSKTIIRVWVVSIMTIHAPSIGIDAIPLLRTRVVGVGIEVHYSVPVGTGIVVVTDKAVVVCRGIEISAGVVSQRVMRLR